MKSRANKGQFSIIAALLTSIILVTAVVMTYSSIRNTPFHKTPGVLSSIGEMNWSIKEILEFSVGYYGSILQVTGNSTYAQEKTSSYLKSGFVNIARSHLEWNPSFEIEDSRFSVLWFSPTSYSLGNVTAKYSLSGLGIQGIKYVASCLLNVTILGNSGGNAKVLVLKEKNQPEIKLDKENFFFYSYDYSQSIWNLVNPVSDPIAYSNGTYVIPIPSGVDVASYTLKVVDLRGIMVTAWYSSTSPSSKIPQNIYSFTWDNRYSSLTDDTIVVEVLQNGTLRWLGQNLEDTAQGRPIPPIPVKAFHINQTIDGVNQEVPFQVEDWGSDYTLPLSLSGSTGLFSSRSMFVFLVTHHVQNVTLWWDGLDTANQTSYATTNRYFLNDDPDNDFLSNGILDLDIDTSGTFEVTSYMGSSRSTANFMRINDDASDYGADPAYVIHHGVVRDIIQQEPEWGGGGATDCPNQYSQIVLTLPANATYYTYRLRTIFVSSAQSRDITDLSAIQISSEWITWLQSLTENGTTTDPIVSETYPHDNNLFYNFSASVWAHHWSEYINGSSGAGLMFTNASNEKLYAFDGIASEKTGALNVNTESTGTLQWTTPSAVFDKCGEYGVDVASHSIDGNTNTHWRHDSQCNHWIVFDMGATKDISKIGIFQDSQSSRRWGGSSGIEVYVSDDPLNWGSAVWTGTLDSGGWQYSGQFSAQGRYVKLVSNDNSKNQRLYEFEVYEGIVGDQKVTIEFNPVDRFDSSFTYPIDVSWHGAVVTFDSVDEEDTIYPSSSGTIGLWVLVEYPPVITTS